MDINSELFDGRSFADILTEIHKNTENKRLQINTYIAKMVQLIRTPEDAAVIGPIVQGFIEVNVKNDEHLVKVAQLVSRLISVSSKTTNTLDTLLTEEEKRALLTDFQVEIKTIQDDIKELDDTFDTK